VTDLPILVDVGTGYGDAIHVRHTVRTMQQAGAAGVQIDDQIYPKRAHYHKGIEHVVPAEEMLMRISAALAGRDGDDFVIVARTDALRTDGYDEAIRRARLYRKAGADMVLMFPNNDDEARRIPGELSGIPVYIGNSSGNRLGRGIYSLADLEEWGWKAVAQSILTVNVATSAVKKALEDLKSTGIPPEDATQMREIRHYIEHIIGLDELYEIERKTVETAPVE
jgi:methylisocitrate lyase